MVLVAGLMSLSLVENCDIQIQNTGPITNAKQQWQIFEERNQEHEDIRNKIIIDISNFINSLTHKHHEVLLGVDVNKSNILYNNGVSQLLHCTNSLI